MEQQLDDIEAGKLPWTKMMHDFYDRFAPWVAAARDSDAPDAGDAQRILKLLEQVSFAPPSKTGKRVFDDRKFVDSVREKFATDGKLSDKQFSALLSIAGKYAGQFPPGALDALPEHLRAEVESAGVRSEARRKRQENAVEANAPLTRVFDAFKNVSFAPATVRGKRTYDDGKFIASLAEQVRSGRGLSDKQLAALKKLTAKYLTQLPDGGQTAALLGIDADVSSASAPAEEEDPKPLLEALAKVGKWAEPVKKGRFTYDDKKFFLSLKQQFDSGKALSVKQLAALKKLAAKYREA